MFKPEDIKQYKKIEARPQLKQRILTEHQARTEASPRLPHSRPRPVFAGVAAFAVICIKSVWQKATRRRNPWSYTVRQT